MTFTFTISRNSTTEIANPLAVDLAVSGTATFGVDYTQSGATSFSTTTASITIPANALSANIVITPTPDILSEPNETIILTIVPTPSVSQLGVNPSATGTIVNDDGGGDPLFASVRLLLHFNGNFTDSSSQNLSLTAAGGVATTATAKFGSGGVYFDGTDDRLTLPTAAVLNVGSGDWCWEFQVNPDVGSFTGTRNLLLAPTGASGFSTSSSGDLIWWEDGFGNVIPAASRPTLVAGSWNYVAFNKAGSTWTVWLNGAQYASFTRAASLDFRSWVLGRGQFNLFYKGHMDEVRFTNASRAITAQPTAAFPDY